MTTKSGEHRRNEKGRGNGRACDHICPRPIVCHRGRAASRPGWTSRLPRPHQQSCRRRFAARHTQSSITSMILPGSHPRLTGDRRLHPGGRVAHAIKHQPWKDFWPLRSDDFSPAEREKMPWLTWKYDPSRPNERPWRGWMLANQSTVARRGAW